MRKLGLFPAAEKKKTYKPKLCEQTTYPGRRSHLAVNVVLAKCIAATERALIKSTAID